MTGPQFPQAPGKEKVKGAYLLVKATRNQDCTVNLWGRDSEGKWKFVADHRPYLYVPEEDSVNCQWITDCEWGFTHIDGSPYRRLYTQNPSDVPEVRKLVTKTGEADIPYARRYLVDHKLTSAFTAALEPCPKPAIRPVVYYLDIECFSHGTMPNPDTDPITCVSIASDSEEASVILDDVDVSTEEPNWAIIHASTEEKLLKWLLRLLIEDPPDILTGWNFSFDLEYLEARCKHHRLYLRDAMEGINTFDLLTAYRALYRQRGYRLKDIALVEGLTQEDEPKVDYGRLWETDKAALLERNHRHALWCRGIDQKRRITEYYWELKELAGLEEMESALYNSVLIDVMLLRRTKWVLPTKERHEHTPYEGAYVMAPPKGVFDNVANFDMSKFYPSVLLSERLDPVILARHPVNRDWEDYKRVARGWTEDTLLLSLVKELLGERDRLQAAGHKEKLAAVKGLVNSLYGVLAHAGFRLYMPEIAARVTEVARDTIKALGQDIEGWGYKVLYCDTDSVYLQVAPEERPQVEERLNEALRKYGDYHIKLEHFFTRILWTGAKKRYAGVDDKGALHIVGFERVKSDSSDFTRKVQEAVIKMALEGKQQDILPYLRACIQNIRQVPLAELAISKTLSRNPDEYAVAQDYIAATRDSETEFKAGDAVKVLPVIGAKHKVAVFQDLSEVGPNTKVDWDRVIDLQIRRKVEDLLGAIGSSWDEVMGQGKLQLGW